MVEKRNPINETTDEARDLARKLVVENRYGVIAVNEVGTGFPIVSRIALAFMENYGVVFLASDLSVHSQCLANDKRCSILFGEPGKGDGLAHPRITLIGAASRLANDSERRPALRSRFLEVHPKAELYIDFTDFGFYPLEVERAQLNGGFGKAFHLGKTDLSFLKSSA